MKIPKESIEKCIAKCLECVECCSRFGSCKDIEYGLSEKRKCGAIAQNCAAQCNACADACKNLVSNLETYARKNEGTLIIKCKNCVTELIDQCNECILICNKCSVICSEKPLSECKADCKKCVESCNSCVASCRKCLRECEYK